MWMGMTSFKNENGVDKMTYLIKCDINYCGECDGSVILSFEGSKEDITAFFKKYEYPTLDDYVNEGFELVKPDVKATVYDVGEKYYEYV